MAAAPSGIKWNRGLDVVSVKLTAQCPSVKVSARELLSLKVGEVLPLQPQSAGHIDVRIGNITKFRGRLGTRDQKWAVEITEVSKL